MRTWNIDESRHRLIVAASVLINRTEGETLDLAIFTMMRIAEAITAGHHVSIVDRDGDVVEDLVVKAPPATP